MKNARERLQLDYAAFRALYPVRADQIEPDAQDFDDEMPSENEVGRQALFRLAQARKLNRLYRAWKAQQN
jgi:hypothetical protein